jgi:hypothetical protein
MFAQGTEDFLGEHLHAFFIFLLQDVQARPFTEARIKALLRKFHEQRDGEQKKMRDKDLLEL